MRSEGRRLNRGLVAGSGLCRAFSGFEPRQGEFPRVVRFFPRKFEFPSRFGDAHVGEEVEVG